jgi:hypothetical protein
MATAFSTKVVGKRYKKGKAIPVTGCEGPQGCERSRLPHFLDSRLTDGGEVYSRKGELVSITSGVNPRAILRLERLDKLKKKKKKINLIGS